MSTVGNHAVGVGRMKLLLLLIAAVCTCASPARGQSSGLSRASGVPAWQHLLNRQLPLFGHRNWVVVADSAYPSQTSPGIKTVYTGEKQLDTVRKVLAVLEKQKHVRGSVFVDAELPHVPEKFATGIGDFRAGLEDVLEGQSVTSLPHSEIIEKLDEAGQTFDVLVLKTDLTLPYTSVFIRLDCGYWSDEAEEQLRAAIAKENDSTKRVEP